MNDCIFLEGFIYECHIGCTPEERETAQRVELNLEIATDIYEVGRSAKLERGVDWAQVEALCSNVIKQRQWTLVEELAEVLAESIFRAFEHTNGITLSLRKFPFPHGRSVGVRIKRKRPSS